MQENFDKIKTDKFQKDDNGIIENEEKKGLLRNQSTQFRGFELRIEDLIVWV